MEEHYTILMISFFGGLGFFLYGLMALSESLQRVAGTRMRYYLETSTKTTIRGVFSGALFTALIQSSSGTTVLVIGLLNARLINLRQAAALIIGSNVGTVITGFIIGIKLSEYSLIFVAIGMFLRMIGNDPKRKEYGRAIFGFGILFFGINMMGESMYPLRDSAYFNQVLLILEKNAVLGLVVGAFLTALMQSSTAMIGILQEMFNQQILTLPQLVPILFGTAVGTTITAGIASLSGGANAKKAALFHFVFNVSGALIFMPLFLTGIYLSVIETLYNNFIGNWDLFDAKMKIATLNAFYKMGFAIIFIPIVDYLLKIVEKIIKDTDDAEGFYQIQLDRGLLKTPSLAYKNVNSEIVHMTQLAKYSIQNAINILNGTKKTSPLLLEAAQKTEDTIDDMREQIRDYAMEIPFPDKTEAVGEMNTYYIFDTIKNLERVGDYAQNIIKAIIYKRDNQVVIPEFFYERINYLGEVVTDSLERAIVIMETDMKTDSEKIDAEVDLIEKNHRAVLKIQKELRTINIQRFSNYENINLINYVVKNIIDNLIKTQLNTNEIVKMHMECFTAHMKDEDESEGKKDE